MSTTMPSSSSSRRRNVASTTYVAPCRPCAGPKTARGRLWATITWSRTVTAYMGLLLVVDDVAHRGELPRGDPAHRVRELRERARTADQHVERVVTQQPQGQREPVGVGPARPPG